MNRAIRAWLLAGTVLLVLLAGCTGTQEDVLPTLLVVGTSHTDGSGSLQLVEDFYEPGAQPPRSLVPVAGSERTLPAPPLAMDVVDRNGARGELVVLAGSDSSASLHFYSLAEIDPAAPGGFAESREAIALGPLLEEFVSPTGAPLCLTDLSVGGSGRFVALLDEGVCRGSFPDIYLVDVTSGTAVSILNENPGMSGILPAGVHVDQESATLYLASEAIDGIDIVALPLTDLSAELEVGTIEFDGPLGERQDLSPTLGGIAYLAGDDLGLLPLEEEADTAGTVSTIGGALSILPDPSGNLEKLVVFAPLRLAIHEGSEDEDPLELSLQARFVDATLDPVQRYAYLLQEGGISILDLYPYADPPSRLLEFFPVEGLSEPRVITWFSAVQGDATAP